jgi:hypothetical protein
MVSMQMWETSGSESMNECECGHQITEHWFYPYKNIYCTKCECQDYSPKRPTAQGNLNSAKNFSKVSPPTPVQGGAEFKFKEQLFKSLEDAKEGRIRKVKA